MKTIIEAIKDLGPKWGSMFDGLYWEETEGYYFSDSHGIPSELVCLRAEFETVVQQTEPVQIHKRNTTQMVELNELCQQHGIGKIGDSVVPALKQYIEQSKQVLSLAHHMIISEIGDFAAAMPYPASLRHTLTPEQIQNELLKRIQRVFTDIKQQACADVQQQDEIAAIKIKAVEEFDKFLYDTFPHEGVNYATYGYCIEEFPKMLRQRAKAGGK